MFFDRFFNLVSGKITRWLKAREARDPEAVYEAAISDRVRRYQQLKSAAAGVIYMRNKLERELRDKTAEITEVAEEAAQAADLNEDNFAVVLIQRKHALTDDCARLRDELADLTREAEDAKKNLVAFKSEIDNLKVEKVKMLARLKNAQARVRIQRALEQLSYDDDVRALEEVRESVQQVLAQAGVNREISNSELDEKLAATRRSKAEARAREELAEIKRTRRPPLAPLEIFTNAAQAASIDGGLKPAN
ncbi:MAG TPA: PspA/IM30 family protein [Candidatus Binataceae bacterium]|nr:PspA/IM30 family protein [Candidatus Binataceae bacterium]